MRLRSVAIVTFLVFCSFSTTGFAESYEEVLAKVVTDLSKVLAEKNIDSIAPDMQSIPGTSGGGEKGHLQIMKELLAVHNVSISGGARYRLVTQLLNGDENYAINVVARLMDKDEVIHEFRNFPLIDDGRDVAEQRGISGYYGPQPSGRLRLASLKPQIKDPVVWGTTKNDFVFTDAKGHYGIGVRVGNAVREFEGADGSPFVRFAQNEVFELLLANNTDTEVAVNIKVDGVNIYHFSDPTFRNPNGSKYLYSLVPPKSQNRILGWVKNSRQQQQFRMAPLMEGAAFQAGIGTKDVGLITATFHASWSGSQNQPSDEPASYSTSEGTFEEYKYTVTKQVPAGKTQTRTVYSTVAGQAPAEKRSVGIGKDVVAEIKGVDRTIGVPRGTVAFRYFSRD